MAAESDPDRDAGTAAWHATLHHAAHDALSAATAQTPGMRRYEAISGRTTGSRKVWMGTTYVPHREENPSPDQEAVVVVTRSTQEGIVVNLPSLRAHVPELDAYLAQIAAEVWR